MVKISYASCLCLGPLFPAMLTQFTLKMCVTAQNREKYIITLFGSSRSFKVISVGTPIKLVTGAG